MRAVRYQQDYEDAVAGHRPHAAPVVVERGYGDCKDKAVLFIELARLAGLRAHFVLLLWFGAADSLAFDVEAALPVGYHMLHTQEDFQVVDRCFAVKFTSNHDEHKVVTHYEYRRTCTELAVADYAAFRKAVQRVLAQPRDLVFAREVVKPAPNLR